MSVLNELIEYKQRDSALGTEYLTLSVRIAEREYLHKNQFM